MPKHATQLPGQPSATLLDFNNIVRASYLHRSRDPKRSQIIYRLAKWVSWFASKVLPQVYGCKPISYVVVRDSINQWCVVSKTTKNVTRVILAGYLFKKQAENARDALFFVNAMAVKNGYSVKWMADFEYALSVKNFLSRFTVAIWNAQTLLPSGSPELWFAQAAITCDSTVAEACSWGVILTEAHKRRPRDWMPEITSGSKNKNSMTALF